MTATVLAGDCVEVMAGMDAESVDAVVTDPPYGLEFMGKEWDSPRMLGQSNGNGRGNWKLRKGDPGYTPGNDAGYHRNDPIKFGAWCETWAAEALRVLKPGGHLLAFGGTRTYHRLACAIEDAGFEIRDALVWLYGSGFPKSLDVSKAIDKAAGAEREVVGTRPAGGGKAGRVRAYPKGSAAAQGWTITDADPQITAPATPEAAAWAGWGTALKPGHEPVVVARKPLAERTVAAQVLATGTGAINVDGCRIGLADGEDLTVKGDGGAIDTRGQGWGFRRVDRNGQLGRWPANVVLDEEAAALLDAEVGERPSGGGVRRPREWQSANAYGFSERPNGASDYAREPSTGGPSRFFYCAKASKRERGEGNNHPTVKPIALMRWLVRLVTPPGGVVLDPFAGSGTTLLAATAEGFRAVGIEREADYRTIIANRLAAQEAEMAEPDPQLDIFDALREAA